MEDLSQKIIICQAGIHWIFCPSKTPRGMGFHPANKVSPEAPPNPIKLGISLALSHQGRKTHGPHRCASVLIRTGGRGGCGAAPLSQPRVSSPAALRGPGERRAGSCLLCFQEAPPEKTSWEHRGFPSAGIQMNPKHSPLQSRRLMSRSPPRCDEGPNEAWAGQRRQLCFLSLLSGIKKKKRRGRRGGRERGCRHRRG